MTEQPRTTAELADPAPPAPPPQPPSPPDHAPSTGDGSSPHARVPLTMGRSVSMGMVWMMMNTVVGRVASLVSQIVLAALLTKADFGIFGTTVAICAFIQLLRDGGIPRYLVQKGPEGFRSEAGALFWMGLTLNFATSLLMVVFAALTPLIPQYRGVAPLLLIMAIIPPLGTPAMIYTARLTLEMRFQTMAKVNAISQLLRHAGIIALALLHFGAYSFVVPMVFAAAFDSAAFYIVTRDKPWTSRFNFRAWPGIVRSTWWVMLGSVATANYNMGEYLVLPFVVPMHVVGVYFFAYQLAKQIIVLVLFNLQTVLLPALSRLNHDPDRQRAAILRTARLLMLMTAPLALLLACVIAPLEPILFRGKWTEAVPVVQVFSFVMTINIMAEIPRTVLVALGRFRLWSCLVLLDMAGLMGAALLGGVIVSDRAGIDVFSGEAHDALGIAIFVGVYSIVSMFVYSTIALRQVRISIFKFVAAFLPALMLTIVVAYICISVDDAILKGRSPYLRVLVVTGLFGGLFLGLARGLLTEDLRQVIANAPARFRGTAIKALRL